MDSQNSSVVRAIVHSLEEPGYGYRFSPLFRDGRGGAPLCALTPPR